MQYTLKKALGQHFLKDDAVSRRIAAQVGEAMSQHGVDRLLEVGPGAGALTVHLLELPFREFEAVEFDREKVAYLFKTLPQLHVREADFLQMDPPFDGQFMIAGNFPYNISSQILFRMIEWREQVPCMTGMFQKEVAERVAAPPGGREYGIISILVQYYYDVAYLFDVPPTAFNPPPKVMSGVITLSRKASTLPVSSPKKFSLLVKTAFNQRRKMLRNGVRGLFAPEILQDELFSKRAEQLSVADFASLTFKMN